MCEGASKQSPVPQNYYAPLVLKFLDPPLIFFWSFPLVVKENIIGRQLVDMGQAMFTKLKVCTMCH